MEFIQNFLPEFPKLPYRNGSGAFEGVVAHATASYAPAANEITYMQRLWREWDAAGRNPNTEPAFVQFFCDWTGSYYIADVNYKAYGAGSIANQRYVHVELCQTYDPQLFRKSYKNYVETLAWVLRQKRLGVVDGKTLVSHDWVMRNLGNTNHTDPIGYLKTHGLSWEDVVRDVALAYDGKFEQDEGDEIMQLSTARWGQLAQALRGYYIEGVISDYAWVEKAEQGTMTHTELAFITMITSARTDGIQVD